MGRRHQKRKRSPEPRDVLTGRVEVKSTELIELIHRVNPTGRELDATQEAERYRQKAELQSLLIRRHGDEHLVVTPAEDEGVVSLSHRGGARDACHAVLDELDPDARAWVRRRLDLAASVSPPLDPPEGTGSTETTGDDVADRRGRKPTPPTASTPGPAESPEELLVTAEQALEEYDYDRAERCLRQAFDLSGGALSTARPLLTFLADQLGQDDAVLALEGRLASAAASHPDLRTILALAAARQGDADGAVRRVTGIEDHPRLAEVEAALAAAALGRGDAEAAVRHRDAVAAHDPGHPRLATLERDLAELRARGRQAAEEALERRYRAAGAEAMEQAARDLLDHWGESDLARRILREIAAAHREEQVAEHLERGESDLADERFAAAVRHFQAALDAGCKDRELPERIADLQARARQSADAERLAAVVARFPPTPDAANVADTTPYLTYLDLPAHLRRQARQALDSRRLELLEEALPAESLSGAKAQALVAGVLALERARTALGRDEPAAALDELTSHQHALRALDEARRLEDEARAQLAAAKRDAAAAQLRAARRAFSAGDLEAARQALLTLALTDLDPAARQRAETFRRRLDRAETAERLEQEAAQHEAAGDLVGALERMRQLADAGDDEDARQRWQDRSTALEGRLRQAWRVEVSEEATPLAEQLDVIPDPGFTSDLGAWLDDEGEELVLTTCWGDELFVRVVDVASRTVRRQISLRLPCALERPESVRDGDRLLLAGAPGAYLELGLADARIVTWRRLDEIVPPGFRVATAQPLPGGRFLWLRLEAPKKPDERILVIDTRTFRIARSLEKTGWQTVLLGAEGPRVLCDDAAGYRLYSDRGTLETRESIEGEDHTGFAASGPPRGESLLSLLLGPADVLRAAADAVADLEGNGAETPADGQADEAYLPGEDQETSVLLARMDASPDGERMECSSILPLLANPDGAHSIASDLTAELTFTLVVTPAEERELLAFDTSGPQLHSLYKVEAPFESLLLQDRRSRHVVVLSRLGHSLTLHPLGSEPPPWEDIAKLPPWPERLFPDAWPPFHCGFPPMASVGYHLDDIKDLSDGRLEDYLRELVANAAPSPDDAIAVLSWLLWHRRWPETVGKCIHQLAALHPKHAGATLLQAEHRAAGGRWAEARRFLEPIQLQDLEILRRCHVRHLLGLSWLAEGRTENALETFRLALDDVDGGGQCSILPLYHLARPMEDPPRPEEWGPAEPFGRQLLGAVRTADAALRAGEAEAARRAIDHPIVWREEELQSAARLASVYLDTPAVKPGERFRKRLALAFFRHVWSRKEVFLRHELPLPEVRWDALRLEDLARRSARWLAEVAGQDPGCC